MSDEKWTKEELEATLLAYQQMLWLEERGIKFVKQEYYRQLCRSHGRTEDAYSYRMRNIAQIYAVLGRKQVSGLTPLGNMSKDDAKILKELIQESDPIVSEYREFFDSEVDRLRRGKKPPLPVGNLKPRRRKATTTLIERDPAVAAWVLEAAGDTCECCGAHAPFSRNDGTRYLEVHHLKRLADGGSDRIENAIAACPNCHRELHYGKKREALLPILYGKVERLVRE